MHARCVYLANKGAVGRDIVDLDARAVRATVGVVADEAGLLGQIVAMLGRSPSWPR
jgi:hypothetical protein